MTKQLSIFSRAPTRIDLAGGTVDLWPLYLFLDRPRTINLGIDLFAEAKLDWNDSAPAGVTLHSDDQGHELKLDWSALSNTQAPPQLELHLKLLRHFAKSERMQGHLTLSTRARSPAGAGLGGSSTLSIAMIGALATWANDRPVDILKEGERLIEVARDIETTVIQVPAGVQDYYGAMFGGLQSLQWGAGAHRREWLPQELLAGLQERLLLFYSGQSRNSGINNWQLFKNFIDRQSETRSQFDRINQATSALEDALLARDWIAVGNAIGQEWATRRTLAAGISTPEMNHAFEIAQGIAPKMAGKVCGAGGGGCFFIYLPTADEKNRVQEALLREGMRPLPFQAVPHGLEVQVTRA